jgi:hypothetical protein
MQMDIRTPIGLLFTLLGVIITAQGFFTRGAAMYKHSLNININIYTGVGLLIFGGLMLWMALLSKRPKKE